LRHPRDNSTRRSLTAGLVVVVSLLAAAPAAAQTSGGSTAPAATTPAPAPVPGAKAKLLKNGMAVAPAGAPQQVVSAIAAGNTIRKFPYRYGGGHQSFSDSGYDCSGAVSYVLYGAGLLDSPLPSGALATSWGAPGRSAWITVYANKGHTYVVVAGLRFDTSAVGEPLRRGSGPRWRATKRKPKGYVARYYPGL
jgi:hypothetical protein